MLAAISRAAPEAVAGWPTSFVHDRAKKHFELHFKGDPAITAPSRIFVPGGQSAQTVTVTCDGAPLKLGPDEATGIVEVPCGGAGSHTIVITGA